MFSTLTKNEIHTATKLIQHSLAKAGNAFQMIVNSPVTVKPVQLGDDNLGQIPEFSDKKSDKKTHLLKTELVGDLKGFCHLILTEGEVSIIQNHCLPQSILAENSPQNRLMKLEHLTEIDNMVAGAVITELANYLALEVYGNVPSLHIMHAEEINKYIHAEAVVYSSATYFKVALEAPELDMKADFIWLFQESFVEGIKELSANGRLNELV